MLFQQNTSHWCPNKAMPVSHRKLSKNLQTCTIYTVDQTLIVNPLSLTHW